MKAKITIGNLKFDSNSSIRILLATKKMLIISIKDEDKLVINSFGIRGVKIEAELGSANPIIIK